MTFIRRMLLPLTLATAVVAAGVIGVSAAVAQQHGPSAHAASAATVVQTRKTSLGSILVGADGHTLYLWDADSTNKSRCSGACASDWPPLTTSGSFKAQGGVKASLLKVIAKPGGGKMLSYAGHPLYYYAGDGSAGQANGEGSDEFGAAWYAVATSGKAIKRG